MRPPLVYVACPYGGNAARLADAADTVRRLNAFWGETARFWAPWIDVVTCRTEADRDRGLAFDLAAIGLSHGVLAIRAAGVLSAGQKLEVEHAHGMGIPVLTYAPHPALSLSDATRGWIVRHVLPFQRRGQ